MLDPPLKLGRRQVGDNQALADLLESWGVTPDKDLLLDESAASQLLGGGPEAPVIMQYDSHPIVNDLTNISTAFPLPARSKPRIPTRPPSASCSRRRRTASPPTI
jgi:ABC-type uncharacterized transport system involved in gliding motility auxiliary subunit